LIGAHAIASASAEAVPSKILFFIRMSPWKSVFWLWLKRRRTAAEPRSESRSLHPLFGVTGSEPGTIFIRLATRLFVRQYNRECATGYCLWNTGADFPISNAIFETLQARYRFVCVQRHNSIVRQNICFAEMRH
jgi:hypothetical protein